jgi:hypothetical protein
VPEKDGHISDYDVNSNGPPGELLVQELLWVHGVLRHDLDIVRRLANEALDGAPADDIGLEIGRLQTQSPLWQLKANCLYYCRFVHMHHRGEDVHLFPALRLSDPALEPVVDRLEADHRKVSEILDQVEEAAHRLQRDDGDPERQVLSDSLTVLAEYLLAHLAYEEESISPTLLTWSSWPFG